MLKVPPLFLLALVSGVPLACTPDPQTDAVAVELGSSFTILHTFVNPVGDPTANGHSVRGALIDVGGRLYGLAGERGPNQGGTDTNACNSGTNWNLPEHNDRCPGSLFSLELDGSDFRVEHAFTQLNAQGRNDDGYHPYGGLSLGPDGRLRGVTQGGGHSPGANPPTARGAGVLFSFDPVTADFDTEYEFLSIVGAQDGQYAMGYVAHVGSAVYGTTKGGGALSSGVVWRHTASGITSRVMVPATDGAAPYGGLTADRDGLLHGMTYANGPNGRGVYFTVHPTTMAFTVVAPFPGFTLNAYGNDNTPIQSPLLLSDGSLIAIREFGGAYGTGLIVRLHPTTGITVLRELDNILLSTTPRFANATGAMPNGQLAEGRDGLIYGTSAYGGASGSGSIWRIARDGSLFELLYSFPAFPAPSYPYGGLTLGSDGAFYGTTFQGGGGAVFRFTPPTTVCGG